MSLDPCTSGRGTVARFGKSKLPSTSGTLPWPAAGAPPSASFPITACLPSAASPGCAEASVAATSGVADAADPVGRVVEGAVEGAVVCLTSSAPLISGSTFPRQMGKETGNGFPACGEASLDRCTYEPSDRGGFMRWQATKHPAGQRCQSAAGTVHALASSSKLGGSAVDRYRPQ